MRCVIGLRGENLSIMIPTYNCAEYLRQTLLSLQAQGDAIAEAQIQVVDDCSTKDDPEAVVREVWGDRVEFYRHPTNQGPCKNFNACVERAQRPWVHLLHGDDTVLPGCYQQANTVTVEHPSCLAVFAPVLFINEKSVWLSVNQPLGPDPHAMLTYSPYQWRNCPVQFSGNIFTKEIIALAGGGFDPSFTHANDWNLWWRMAKTGRVAYSSQCAGAYRIFAGNHTATLMKTAKNVDEYLEQLRRLRLSLVETGHSEVKIKDLYQPQFINLMLQTQSLAADRAAFRANIARIRRFPIASWKILLLLRTLISK